MKRLGRLVRGLSLVHAGFDDDSGTSIVRAGALGELTVRHDFVPAPETPNLYRVDVTVTNSTPSLGGLLGGYYGPLAPTYRRVMDWDVEPTAFSEFVTIDAQGGALPPEVVAATNDGFADPDPRSPATDLGGVELFTDLGPDDHGALFDVQLPELDPGGVALLHAVVRRSRDQRGCSRRTRVRVRAAGSPTRHQRACRRHRVVRRGHTPTPRNDGVVRQ